MIYLMSLSSQCWVITPHCAYWTPYCKLLDQLQKMIFLFHCSNPHFMFYFFKNKSISTTQAFLTTSTSVIRDPNNNPLPCAAVSSTQEDRGSLLLRLLGCFFLFSSFLPSFLPCLDIYTIQHSDSSISFHFLYEIANDIPSFGIEVLQKLPHLLFWPDILLLIHVVYQIGLLLTHGCAFYFSIFLT